MMFDFPRFIPRENDLRFSFSGLKTSLLYQLKKMTDTEIGNCYSDLCASYQEAAFDQLVKTVEKFWQRRSSNHLDYPVEFPIIKK